MLCKGSEAENDLLAVGFAGAEQRRGEFGVVHGVAMECQNYPDAVNHPEFPSPLLRPGETYCQKIVFRFGTFA